jgi:hypothetical protein
MSEAEVALLQAQLEDALCDLFWMFWLREFASERTPTQSETWRPQWLSLDVIASLFISHSKSRQ